MSHKQIVFNFIIVNYNSGKDAIDCMSSILNLNCDYLRIFIVDNESTDDSMSLLVDFVNKWKSSSIYYSVNDFEKKTSILPDNNAIYLISSNNNLGFAKANNIVIKYLLIEECNVVILINPDMVLDKSFSNFIIEINENPQILQNTAFGIPTYDFYTKKMIHIGLCQFSTWTGGIKSIKNMSLKYSANTYINGGFLLCNINLFKKCGLLPTEYFLYWEETDWCYSFHRIGGEISHIKSAKCYDKGGVSTGGRGNLSLYYYTKNSFKFFKKHLPMRVFSLLFAKIFFALYYLIRCQKSRAFTVYKGISHGVFS